MRHAVIRPELNIFWIDYAQQVPELRIGGSKGVRNLPFQQSWREVCSSLAGDQWGITSKLFGD